MALTLGRALDEADAVREAEVLHDARELEVAVVLLREPVDHLQEADAAGVRRRLSRSFYEPAVHLLE